MKTLIDGPIARDPKMGRIEIRQRSRAIDDPWGDPMRGCKEPALRYLRRCPFSGLNARLPSGPRVGLERPELFLQGTLKDPAENRILNLWQDLGSCGILEGPGMRLLTRIRRVIRNSGPYQNLASHHVLGAQVSGV